MELQLKRLVTKEKKHTKNKLTNIARNIKKKYERKERRELKIFLFEKGPGMTKNYMIKNLINRFKFTEEESKKIYLNWRKEYLRLGVHNEGKRVC